MSKGPLSGLSQSSYSQPFRLPTCPPRLKVVRKSVSLVIGQRGNWKEVGSIPAAGRGGRESPVVPPRDHGPCPSPETGKGAEERPGCHAHGATHHKAHLHSVEAAWL